MSNSTRVLPHDCISEAWANVFDLAMASSTGHVGPLIVEVQAPGGQVNDNLAVRSLLDAELKARDLPTVHETSALIFDFKLWNTLKRPGIASFTDFYLNKLTPRLLKRNYHRNGKGTYFQRMVEFTGLDYHKKAGYERKTVNQLERIIDVWNKSGEKGRHPRHSALQATIFDPAKDHHGGAQCGFPCLQQVSFDYLPGDNLARASIRFRLFLCDKSRRRARRSVCSSFSLRLRSSSCVVSLIRNRLNICISAMRCWMIAFFFWVACRVVPGREAGRSISRNLKLISV
jgi:hypothetical protein